MHPVSVKHLFSFCKIGFHHQYLHYGDFDQHPSNDPIFQEGIINHEYVDVYDKSEFTNMWQQYSNHQIISELNYSRYSLT